MPVAAIKTRKLTKYYGKHRGIEALDLTVSRGEIFGFLGPNGAGKTTTINLLMGFRSPSSGSARVLGKPVGPGAIATRKDIGFSPGELALYDRLTARQTFTYFANLRGVKIDHAVELAGRFGLDLDRKASQLSKGNKQKIGLIQALMHQPKLLILDEPTSGLDPLVQQEFHRIIRQASKNGATIFLSSHVLSEVEHMCDRAAIIREGRLVTIERMSSLHERSVRHLEIDFFKRPPQTLFQRIPEVSDVRFEGRIVHCTVRGQMDRVVKAIAKHRVKNLISEHASLEEFFFQEYEGDDA